MQARFEIIEVDDEFELLIAIETEHVGEVDRRRFKTREEAEAARDLLVAELRAGEARTTLN